MPVRIIDQTWQLVIYNANHMDVEPHEVIRSASYGLVDYLMDNLCIMFKDNGYRTFKLMIRCCESGAIIRDERSP